MQLPRGQGPALTLALLAGLACSQPRSGADVADAAPSPSADAAALAADAATTATPTVDGPAAMDAPPAPPADGPRAPDAAAALDGPPGACKDDFTCPTCLRCERGACVAIADGTADDTGPFFCGGDQRCDGKGTCRSMLGQVCSRSDDCLSGFCRSSVCCDSDCAGSCRHCLLPGRAGTCIDVNGPAAAIGCTTDADICLAANRCQGPDQSCTARPASYLLGTNPVGQTFVTGRSGRLVAVRVALACLTGEQITLEIQSVTSALPDGRALTSQVVSGPNPSQAVFDEHRLIPLATPVPVRAGDRLAIVFKFSGPSHCSVNVAPDCYPDGQTVNYSTNPPAWYPTPDRDIPFRTYVTD